MDGRARDKARSVPLTNGANATYMRNEVGNKLAVQGPTVPTDATAGFAPGCIFQQTDGVAGTCLYVNEGTAASCDFNPLLTDANDRHTVSMHAQAATAMVDQSFFLADRAYQVVGINFVHAVAETTAATLLCQVTKDTGTNAPGAGTDLLTNNTNTGFDCKATANTVQNGTLTATAASLVLAAGDRLSVDFSAAATELVGVTITVILKRV
jgi:hypothetical protein